MKNDNNLYEPYNLPDDNYNCPNECSCGCMIVIILIMIGLMFIL